MICMFCSEIFSSIVRITINPDDEYGGDLRLEKTSAHLSAVKASNLTCSIYFS
jgi:hypothetical protein